MKRVSFRVISFILVMVMIVPAVHIKTEAYTLSEINARNVFLKQKTNYTCTLASAAMLLRRSAIIKGDANWSSITETSLRRYAWIENEGLLGSFRYMGYSVKSKSLPGGSSNKQKLISILKEHPEGVILYDRGTPHAVLLTDYTDGKFYCADPAESRSKGRISISSAKGVTINNADKYWYVSSGIGKKVLEEEKKPEEVKPRETTAEDKVSAKENDHEKPDPVGAIIKKIEWIGVGNVIERSAGFAALLLVPVIIMTRI